MPWSTRLFSTEKEPGSLLPAKSTNLYLPLSGMVPPWLAGLALCVSEWTTGLGRRVSIPASLWRIRIGWPAKSEGRSKPGSSTKSGVLQTGLFRK